jgi:hypothetical protein
MIIAHWSRALLLNNYASPYNPGFVAFWNGQRPNPSSYGCNGGYAFLGRLEWCLALLCRDDPRGYDRDDLQVGH